MPLFCKTRGRTSGREECLSFASSFHTLNRQKVANSRQKGRKKCMFSSSVFFLVFDISSFLSAFLFTLSSVFSNLGIHGIEVFNRQLTKGFDGRFFHEVRHQASSLFIRRRIGYSLHQEVFLAVTSIRYNTFAFFFISTKE